MQKNRRLGTFVLVVLASCAGLLLYFFVMGHPEGASNTSDSGNSERGNSNYAHSLPEINSASQTDPAATPRVNRQGLRRKDEQQTELGSNLASIEDDPTEFPTVVSFLEHIATTRNIDRKEISSNLLAWRHLCSKTRTSNNNFHTGYDSRQYRNVIEKFESFCTGIDDSAEFAGVESPSENLDVILGNEPPISVFDDLDTMNRELALDIVIRELEAALDRLSVPRAQVVIMEIIANRLYPGVNDRGINSWGNLLSWNFPAAFTLVCQQLGGCNGTGHPFVVAYCLETTTTAHRLCNLPGSMSEAIYQTMTPVEHQQYLALLSWINTELAKRRTSAGG